MASAIDFVLIFVSLELVTISFYVLVGFTQRNPASLEAAVSLYRGPLLEGWVEEYVFQERQAREEAYLQAAKLDSKLAPTVESLLRTPRQRIEALTPR